MQINKRLLNEMIETRLENDLRNGNVGGGIIAVRQNGEIKFMKGFGEVHFGQGDTPDEKTLFRLASMTKPITVIATMILMDRHLLDPEDTVEKYLPQYKQMTVGRNRTLACNKLKIHHLLSHSGGIGNIGDWNNQMISHMTEADRTSVESCVNFYATEPLAFEPGEGQCYSPMAGFNVLARIIEVITHKSFTDFVQEEICQKLGMTDTVFSSSKEQLARKIYMHNKLNGKSVNAKNFPDYSSRENGGNHYTGGAGLASTLADYSKFAEMLLQEGAWNGMQIVSKEAIRRMSSPQVSRDIMPGPEQWGYGVRVITDEAYQRLPIGSYGWSGAYGTHFWIDPANKITAIYLKNSLYDGGSHNVTGANLERDVAASLVSYPITSPIII